jgi:uncharacterized protein
LRMTMAWDEICRRCGRCCYEKLDLEGEIFYTDEPCEFLDLKTRMCTVYPERHKARPGCAPLTPEHLSMGILPADCPYVEDLPNYRSPRLYDRDED